MTPLDVWEAFIHMRKASATTVESTDFTQNSGARG